MKYWADLHLHTDLDPKRNQWHGERPERLAKGIVDSKMNVYSTTEHNRINPRFFDVQAEVDRLLEVRRHRKKILGLLGVELSVTFQGNLYHAYYVFEKPFNRQNLPEIPPPYTSLEKLEHALKIDYPGILILAHPAWRDEWKGRTTAMTRELLKSGLVDGAEILNGSMLHNGARIEITRNAMKAFLRTHHGKCARKPAAIGASDAHKADVVGTAFTEFYADQPEGIFDAVKERNTRAYSRDSESNAKVKSLCRELPDIKKFVGVKKP